ncbi:cyclase family protein [Pseudomonadota bacterium]
MTHNTLSLPRTALALTACLLLPTPSHGAPLMIDLTHPLGTFNPTDGDLTKPDLSSPHGDSIAVPTFGNQAVYEVLPDFPTNQGHFVLGRFLVYEHHGTHMDSSYHFQNNEASQEPDPQRKLMHEMTADDLIGPAVVIDIGSRVQTELDKNGGKPSPDANVTDFSDDSPNVIMAEDIDAIADQIDNGVWIVANLG